MVNVINKRTTFYIGRPSPLGNPFVIGTHGTREEVIDLYEVWLKEKIKTKDEHVCKELNKLYKIALNEDIQLICFCKPADCHGRIIKEVLEEKIKSK